MVLDGIIKEELVAEFLKGVTLADGTKLASAGLEILYNPTEAIVTITEGKYHQIKRMFGTVGLGVNSLHREAIGNLTIPAEMREGDWIEMSKQELEMQIK